MSNDRKPGRVRVLKAKDDGPRRRRNDTDPVVVNGKPVAVAKKSGITLTLVGLFLIAVVACAAATELYLL
jgi:hypothetical protein